MHETEDSQLFGVKRAGQKVAGLGMLAGRKTLTGALRCVKVFATMRRVDVHEALRMCEGLTD